MRGGETSARPESDPDRGVEESARDRTERANHDEAGETERQREAREADSELRECRGQNSAAAATEYEPERADELSRCFGNITDVCSRMAGDAPPVCCAGKENANSPVRACCEPSERRASSAFQYQPRESSRGSKLRNGPVRSGRSVLATRKRHLPSARGSVSLRWDVPRKSSAEMCGMPEWRCHGEEGIHARDFIESSRDDRFVCSPRGRLYCG